MPDTPRPGRVGRNPTSPEPPSSAGLPAHPPAPLTPIIGRETELTGLIDLVCDQGARLVTLTGPAGVGKTRLAIAAAPALAQRFADGVRFIPLAPLRDAQHVLATVATGLAVAGHGSQPVAARLAAHLHPRDLVLILDNLEHLLAAGPELARLLTTCPHLRLVVTSRAVLRLSGERELPVGPLAVPEPSGPLLPVRTSEAVRLFVERVRAHAPGFAPDEPETRCIAGICRQVDGLPLAIELAAARCNVLSPQALHDRLSQRLPVLTSGNRDHPHRFQTMRRAIAWSYDLLAPAQQRFFARLSVFVGGFTVEAAAAVAGSPLPGTTGAARVRSPGTGPPEPPIIDRLASLLDTSLLQRHHPPAPDGSIRFFMLETIREFAAEQLAASGDAPNARDRHARYFLALAESVAPALSTEQEDRILDRLEADHDNLRAALDWLTEQGNAPLAVRLASALWRFWYARGHLGEGRRRLAAALALDGAAGFRAQALTGAGYLAWAQGDFDQAAASFEASLALARAHADQPGMATALDGLGRVASYQADDATARTIYDEALRLHRALGDDRAAARTRCYLGVVAGFQGDYALAGKLLDEALTVFRAIDDRECIADALGAKGMVALGEGHPTAARRCLVEANTIMTELSLRPGMAKSLTVLGDVFLHENAPASARDRYQMALALLIEVDDRWWLAWCLEGVAGLAATRGRPLAGARLLGAAAALRAALRAPQPTLHQATYQRAVTACQSRLPPGAFQAAELAGRDLSFDQVIAEARAELAAGGDGAHSPGAEPDPDPGLTQRERDVLRLLVAGRSDREIAAALYLSPRTVHTHVAHLRAKFAVSSRTEVVARAIHLGLV